jgi:predicted  nucleic acid-binding Zn-ribbon protein
LDLPAFADYNDRRELRAIALEVRKREDRIKQLEEELMDVKNEHAVLVADVVLRDDKIERIKQLEDRIHRASMAFFRDGSDGHVASQMLQILEEERGKP